MRIACPTCQKPCSSRGSLTMHMNAMHLSLSPSQLAQIEAYKGRVLEKGEAEREFGLVKPSEEK